MIKRKIFWVRFISAMFLSMSLSSCGKSKTNNPSPTVVTPNLIIQDASQARYVMTKVMTFYLSLNKSTTKDVSVDYNVVNGTAVSPTNFEAVSGTITIPASQTQAKIDVTINGDSLNLRRPNMQFTVKLSNPQSCDLVTDSATGTIITENGTYLPTGTIGYETPISYPGYKLVWSDEFSGNQLNPNYWTAEIGNGTGGWGNNELEYYTESPKNVFVSNGNLIIEARKELKSNFSYTSARIKTEKKESFKYGRIDIRAKLPYGQGVWPALWMLGSNISSVGWPACGETDIMELLGSAPNLVHATLHWNSVAGGNAQKTAGYNLTGGDFSQQFHVFSTDWVPDTIRFYVDDHLYLTVTKTDVGTANYPFNANQFFIFNVAVGGNWPGSPDATTVFPQRMFVDYVRVFQQTKK